MNLFSVNLFAMNLFNVSLFAINLFSAHGGQATCLCGYKWRWVVSFTLRPTIPLGEEPIVTIMKLRRSIIPRNYWQRPVDWSIPHL
jgi:hypothetical protein